MLAAVGLSALLGFAVDMPAWLWMWVLAGTLWAGFKVMNFRREGGFRAVNPLFFGWIGTDAGAFRYDRSVSGAASRIAGGLAFTAGGVVLVLVVLPRWTDPYATGWLGLAAMLSVLHFGVFAILAGIWRRLGFPVEPIMRAPWVARTLGEFWGPRWNRAFSDWARPWVFRPLVRRLGMVGGTLAGFFASGLAHEVVISLPARGGFGLPTAYFLVQAAGVLAQRRIPAIRSPFVTVAVVLIPAPMLFHPVFIERVFAPMIEALHISS